MKKYLKEKSNITALATITLVLVIMAGVGLYYLQSSRKDTNYIYAFGYGVLFIGSLFVLLHNALLKNKENKTLSLGVSLFSLTYFAAAIMGNIDKLSVYSFFVIDVGMALLVSSSLVFGEKSFSICKFLKSKWIKIAVAIISLLILSAKEFLYFDSIYLYGVYGAWILIILYGVVASVTAVIKKKETVLNWANIIASASLICVYVQKITSSYFWVKTSKGITLVALAVMLLSLTTEAETDNNVIKNIKK